MTMAANFCSDVVLPHGIMGWYVVQSVIICFRGTSSVPLHYIDLTVGDKKNICPVKSPVPAIRKGSALGETFENPV